MVRKDFGMKNVVLYFVAILAAIFYRNITSYWYIVPFIVLVVILNYGLFGSFGGDNNG